MPDLFEVIEMPIVEGNVNVTSQAEDPKPLTSRSPVQLKVGDQNIQSLVTVYEPRPEYPMNQKIDGKGYRLNIGEFSSDGKLKFMVSFPKYPFPKGQ
jgi:hypothetical protein